MATIQEILKKYALPFLSWEADTKQLEEISFKEIKGGMGGYKYMNVSMEYSPRDKGYCWAMETNPEVTGSQRTIYSWGNHSKEITYFKNKTNCLKNLIRILITSADDMPKQWKHAQSHYVRIQLGKQGIELSIGKKENPTLNIIVT